MSGPRFSRPGDEPGLRELWKRVFGDSDAFLDMPASARCLYFTLGMFADDDGFVGSPKGIMRQCGASNDDMKILLAKKFVLDFESGVIVIKHWRINNYLQNDRHKNTTYIDELNTLSLDEKGAYTKCIQNVYTGKDSIDQYSIDNIDISSKNPIDYQKIVDLYHKNCPSLPKVTKITEARKKLINARLKDYSEEELENAFRLAEASDFLTGRNGKWGGANFDWVMNTNNIVKILEGNYKNKSKGNDANKGLQTSYTPDFFAELEAEVRAKGN